MGRFYFSNHHKTFFISLFLLLWIGCDQRRIVNEYPEWISMFNGEDLSGWTVKINNHEVGKNWGNTFRVQDGILSVRYDEYNGFKEQFGHLYYNKPYSYYHLKAEYRFVGVVLKDAPGYANRNSGIMFHSQSPYSMPKNQNWPISVELQLLSGFGDGTKRTTANMCSPGTHVVYDDQLDENHCINSNSKTFEGDAWVSVELIVLGDSLVTHIVEGDTVLQYSKPQMGGGIVNNYDPSVFQEGKILTQGYIALQSEGQPIDFRNIQLLNLEGYTDKKSPNYRSYYVESRSSDCTE